MAKRTPLKVHYESEFRIVGIVCSEADYRFCWMLNHYLGFDFRRTSDFMFYSSRSKVETRFSVFEYQGLESLQYSFFLVNNRSYDDAPLFANPPGLDFLLLVKADEYRFDFKHLLANLRSIQQLSGAYQLDEALGKDKEAFLYDFEVFLYQEVEGIKKKEEVKWINGD